MNKPTPKRRRVNRATGSQSDLISQLEQGTGVSTRSKKILKDMQTKDADKKSEVHDEPLFNSGAYFDLVLIDYVRPQEDNSRYLPIISNSGNKSDTSELTNCVVCEKGLIENRLDIENPRYDEIEREISKIRLLADSIKNNGLVQPITVWRGNTSNYPIISGHRRYYAIVYLYGRMAKFRVKIYPEKPKRVRILRHIENFSREDLAPSDTLRSWNEALDDLTVELSELKNATERLDLVTKILGVSKSQYYRYEKLAPYFETVVPLMDRGILTSIDELYTDFVKLEKQGGKEAVLKYLTEASNAGSKVNIDAFVNALGGTPEPEVKAKRGREKTFISLPRVKANQSDAIFRLLKEDVTQLDTGVDWANLNRNNPKEIEQAIKSIIDILCKT